MSFHVGQKVVCVDDDWTAPGYDVPTGLTVGSVYTITGVISSSVHCAEYMGARDHLALLLAEVDHPIFPDIGFASPRFRPVKTTDISIFRAMLVAPPKQRVRA